MEAVVQIRAGSPMLVSGPTNSGKTFWVSRLLSNEGMFTEKVKSVLYCYGVWQKMYNEIKSNSFCPIEFVEGIPSRDKVDSYYDGDFHVIILDDLMEKIVKSQDMQELFSKYCHHMNMSAVFISQNIFQAGPHTRTISLNCHIIVLFANKRDESQVKIVGRQFFPQLWRKFLNAYNDATSKPFGYLLIDCTPQHPRQLQLRTGIFPSETSYTYCIE